MKGNLVASGCIPRRQFVPMPMLSLPDNTVRCKICGSVVGLRSDGTIRNHQGRTGPCPMSNLKP